MPRKPINAESFWGRDARTGHEFDGGETKRTSVDMKEAANRGGLLGLDDEALRLPADVALKNMNLFPVIACQYPAE
jgi:hypothetical protein